MKDLVGAQVPHLVVSTKARSQAAYQFILIAIVHNQINEPFYTNNQFRHHQQKASKTQIKMYILQQNNHF